MTDSDPEIITWYSQGNSGKQIGDRLLLLESINIQVWKCLKQAFHRFSISLKTAVLYK